MKFLEGSSIPRTDDPGQYPLIQGSRIRFTTRLQDFVKDSLFTIAIRIDSLEQNKTIHGGGIMLYPVCQKSDTFLVSEFSTLVRYIICNFCLLTHHFH